MFFTPISDNTELIIKMLDSSEVSDKQFLEHEIGKWLESPKRKEMVTGFNYYGGIQDILFREREVIGKDGKLEPVYNLPNNKIVDNLYAKMVDQKVNYLLGNEITIKCDNEQKAEQVREALGADFDALMREVMSDTLNAGIGWLYVYYGEDGKLAFRRIEPWEVIPFFKDSARTDLQFALRVFDVDVYDGGTDKRETHVELYTKEGIQRFILEGGVLTPDVENEGHGYIRIQNEEGVAEYGWDKVPLIPFKSGPRELSLISRVKSLQDAINEAMSDFQNRMQEDCRNTIIVLKNYDGTDLGEFRQNLSTYGAVKVSSFDGGDGGVSTLQVDVNAENYQAVLSMLKAALIENARGFDNKDDRLNGNPNEMNIQSAYADIDLDSRTTELEFQTSLEQLMWFINGGEDDSASDKVEFIFNRSMMLNESADIEKCVKSQGMISDETLLARHPFVDDVNEELKRLAEQKEKQVQFMSGYDSAHTDQVVEEETETNEQP